MRLASLSAALAASLLGSIAHGHPTRSSIVHEKRDQTPPEWVKISRATAGTPLDLRIGLAQSNLHRAEEFVHQVSHPRSERYGQFWSAQDVIDMFAPSQEAVSGTVQWLLQSGIDSKTIKPSAGRNWIKVNTTVGEAEKLLETTYYTYKNDEGIELVACDSYSVPKDIQSNIDLIMPTIQLETRGLASSDSGLRRRDGLSPKINILASNPDPNSLDHCDQATTPACLRAQYGLPETGESVEGNSYGIVEFAPQSYDQTDLNGFFSTYASNVPNDTAPIVAAIDGGLFSHENGSSTRGESNLDLCYAIGLVHPQKVTLYQVGDGDFAQPATNNNFLDAIDGSYCTFEGGDDKDWDAIYPHDGSLPGEWMGPPDCGTQKATNVISVSYGSTESARGFAYRNRECTEYMKLGLMGVTVLFSSGDDGVAGGGYGRFNPMYPGTCPWITSVGGSGLPQGGKIGDKEVASYTFPSGGGFSNYFPLPDYQASAVATYYANHAPEYNSSRYNDTQQVRGFPDVAVFAQDYTTGIDGGFQQFSGTSAASPTFGAMITLINGERIKNGKGPVGFLNPVLYSHPEIFNDITEGTNPGCGTQGFSAVEGWDPVTGLGAPKFDKLREVLLSLP
ncbi:Aorsin [Cladobotryum mycophilum]|uniref:Aorsin n=1 Tax=Cladobotryum mycophilum TaxID=491253 RepID=A0ABR0SRW7_9HYPO